MQSEPPAAHALDNRTVAARLRLLADLQEIRGEPVYRTGAYRRAAESIEGLAESVVSLRAANDLESIPGVGKGIAERLTELVDTGRIGEIAEIGASIPVGVADLLSVPDIGAKRARQIYEALRVDSLEALRTAAADGTLATVPGLGQKAAERIRTSLQGMADIALDDRMPLPVARRAAAELIAQLRAARPEIVEMDLAGSARRFRESIGDLDFVAAAPDPEVVIATFAALPAVARIEMRGENRCRVHLHNGIAADLRVVAFEQYGSLLHHFTGSKSHNVRLREIAQDLGWSQSEYGFRNETGLRSCATEEEVYAFLGMESIPPPMRENTGEIELALRHALPSVISTASMRADLHLHTTWSDGTGSVEEMARAAIARGYTHLCITDHSYGLGVANGLDAARLLAQRAEIDQVNARLAPFRVLQGSEVEVRTDGSLDLPDEVLERLDLVIASVHSGTRRGKEQTTARAVAALRHPLVDILAHPTGRVLGQRAEGDFDVEELVRVAAETGTALEINGSRVDLSDVHARAAVAAGCRIAIDSDAHSPEGLAEIELAIGTAQRAWVPVDSAVNAWSVDELLLRRKRTNRV